jgi:hypothetical protein
MPIYACSHLLGLCTPLGRLGEGEAGGDLHSTPYSHYLAM